MLPKHLIQVSFCRLFRTSYTFYIIFSESSLAVFSWVFFLTLAKFDLKYEGRII